MSLQSIKNLLSDQTQLLDDIHRSALCLDLHLQPLQGDVDHIVAAHLNLQRATKSESIVRTVPEVAAAFPRAARLRSMPGFT